MKISSNDKLKTIVIALLLLLNYDSIIKGETYQQSQAIKRLVQMAEILSLDPGNSDALSTCNEILESQSPDSLFWDELCKVDRSSIISLYSNGIEIKRSSSVGIELALIPKGSVTKTVIDNSGMMPVDKEVQLNLSKGFWISTKEITVGQYLRFLNDTKTFISNGYILPSELETETIPLKLDKYNCYTLSDDYFADSRSKPMVMVSYNDALEFCNWLSQMDKASYNLPTEIQWELASRGVIEHGPWFFGNEKDKLQEFCWYDINFSLSPAQVGKKKPNIFGLYDIYGNVWEWCLDWYLPKPWPAVSQIDDPTGPKLAIQRVIRGGSWQSSYQKCNSQYRSSANPELKDKAIGFRIVINSQ